MIIKCILLGTKRNGEVVKGGRRNGKVKGKLTGYLIYTYCREGTGKGKMLKRVKAGGEEGKRIGRG